MSAPLVIGVGLIGGLGALARFTLDGAVAAEAGRGFPFGTLVVNIIGALVLGVLVGAAVAHDTYELAGIGLVGAFTTFSTWVFESHRLGEDGELTLGIVNIAVSLLLGIVAAWAGRELGMSL